MLLSGSNSYWNWACCLKEITGQTISKQAIFSRMKQPWVETVKALVREVISEQAAKQNQPQLFKKFKNVWIQDSTCLQLPEVLFAKFRCKIMEGEKKSVAKLNIIVNAISGHCALMEWESFTVNEITLAKHIFSIAKAGELVIRDLGYFSLSSFRAMNESGVNFLSRLRPGVLLYDADTGQPIKLLKLLKGKPYIDTSVLCGKTEQLKVRFVAIRLPVQQANERRRRAKKHHRKTTNHGKEYYALLDYLFFISNVEEDIWDYKELAEAYRVRWSVEILFKSWKSGFKIKDMIPDARIRTERVESILYLLLLYIAWFQLLVYYPLRLAMERQGKHLSLIKAAKWIRIQSIVWVVEGITDKMKRKMEYYCSYDTRRRTNTALRLEHFLNRLA